MSYQPKSISKFRPSAIPAEMQTAINSFEDNWLSKHKYTGDLKLYHYTTPEGLNSIIRNRSIWSTNNKFLNDPLELQYGSKIIFDKVKLYNDREENSTIKKILESLDKFDDARKYLYSSVYIACFSEKVDSLNQWIMYAAKGFGYNLGILFKSESPETKYSHNIELLKPNRPIDLRKVIYNPLEQLNTIDNLLSEFVLSLKNMLRKKKIIENGSIKMIAMVLYNFLLELMISMKSPSFKEEQEWRLIYMPFKDDDPLELIKFRISNNKPTPYHETYIYEEKGGILEFPLQSINIGPMLDKEKTKKSLKVFLDSMSVLPNPINLNKNVSINSLGKI